MTKITRTIRKIFINQKLHKRFIKELKRYERSILLLWSFVVS